MSSNRNIQICSLLVFAILSFWICGCYPAYLSGNYSTARTSDLVGTIYRFNRDSTFASNGWTCMSSDTGFGHYYMTHDSLYIVYDTLEEDRTPRLIIDTLGTAKDSCRLKFYVHNSRAPLNKALILMFTRKGTFYDGVTDSTGYCNVQIPADSFPLFVECTGYGYYNVRTVIEKPFDLNLSIRMSESNRIFMEPHTYVYGLKRVGMRKIVLSDSYVDADGQTKNFKWRWYKK